jgi:hypothetical protein
VISHDFILSLLPLIFLLYLIHSQCQLNMVLQGSGSFSWPVLISIFFPAP